MSEGVFVGVPSYDGRVEFATATAISAGSNRQKYIASSSSSLLAMGFNMLWCMALNERAKHGFKWFAMLHGDIIPEAGWLDTLISEAEKRDADVVSAVVPFKDQSGYTSTAIEDPQNPWTPFCRLTQTQVRSTRFPGTFDAQEARKALSLLLPRTQAVSCPAEARLLVNTGCFVARIDRPWAEKVYFTISDRITQRDGKFVPEVQPEDWQFSRQVAELGGKVMATKLVKLAHRGPMNFDSHSIWGQARDHLYKGAA